MLLLLLFVVKINSFLFLLFVYGICAPVLKQFFKSLVQKKQDTETTL